MTRIELFSKEIELISNEKFKKFLIAIIDGADDYFFSVAASTTGKYHPEHSLGVGGLLRHTKQVFDFASLICELKQFKYSTDEKELIKIAAIAHDIKKLGDGKSGYTVTTHPQLASKYMSELNETHKLLSSDELKFLCDAIETHMGQWGDRLPDSESEKILHIADYLASRKEIEYTFSSDDLKNTKLGKFDKSTPKISDVSRDKSDSTITENTNIEDSEYVFMFGKYSGTKISEIPRSYLEWCSQNLTNQIVVSEIQKFLAK